MQTIFFDQAAPKKSTNLSINQELLKLARENHINLSQTLEQHLAELLEENLEAINIYNSRIEKQGVFSDGLRLF